MTVTMSPIIDFTAIETVAVDGAASSQITFNGFNLANVQLNGTSNPVITKPIYHTYTLVAAAKTIDLTALVDSVGAAYTALGLKLQSIIIKNPAGNHDLNIAPGASNGYAILGAGNDFTLPGGATLGLYIPEGTPDVAAGAKTLDITGTGTESFKIGMTFG